MDCPCTHSVWHVHLFDLIYQVCYAVMSLAGLPTLEGCQFNLMIWYLFCIGHHRYSIKIFSIPPVGPSIRLFMCIPNNLFWIYGTLVLSWAKTSANASHPCSVIDSSCIPPSLYPRTHNLLPPNPCSVICLQYINASLYPVIPWRVEDPYLMPHFICLCPPPS